MTHRDKNIDFGPGFIGIEAQQTAEKYIGKLKAGSTGVHIMRLPISGNTDRAHAWFLTGLGAESPGPAGHFPNTSCLSSRGCPVFAMPNSLDSDLARNQRELIHSERNRGVKSFSTRQPKETQVLRRWPTFTHFRNGKISGNLGSDSPGPAVVSVADHDPFRPMSFLKKDVCHPPPIACKEAPPKRRWRPNMGSRRA